MRKNVIILTSGLSGSSVLTGLVARAGFWTGEVTFRKQGPSAYETFENQALVDLNRKLLDQAGCGDSFLMEFSASAIQRVSALYPHIECGPYRAFIEQCGARQPWVWKDPRLWQTIRFWRNFLDLDRCRFILLTRASMQSWVSATLRRQIMTYRYSKEYEGSIKNSILEFFKDHKLSHLELGYEDL